MVIDAGSLYLCSKAQNSQDFSISSRDSIFWFQIFGPAVAGWVSKMAITWSRRVEIDPKPDHWIRKMVGGDGCRMGRYQFAVQGIVGVVHDAYPQI